MGTTWRVAAVPGEHTSVTEEALQVEIEAVLEAVNASMSTYRADSEVSRFNAAPVGEWFEVSSDFYLVLSSAMAISWQSNGAYDLTVGPLVNLWGFGPGDRTDEPPSSEAIDAVMAQVGQDKLRVDGEIYSVLKQAELYLDFSSIAKGFAVDELARVLAGAGFENYLVEIGGEMRVAGQSPRGDAWRIAIEKPEAVPGGIAQAFALEDEAVATSGDYRNFFEADGVRYSHTIDPRTGEPVAHELVSVTVVHPSCMMADAWATALTVLGAEEARIVAEAAGLAVYFIQREGDGYSESYTDAFAPYLQRTDAAN
ncbi:FAD:protein FMN transferase [Halioglobus maricola]|nr:FAD:protein FMN transferase [Halioglobus maricola]